MRDIPCDPSLSRTIAARLRIDDERVRFTSTPLADRQGSHEYYDSEDWNGGILRVATSGGYYWTSYAQNGAAPFPTSWAFSVYDFQVLKPGLFGNKLFYRNASEYVATRTFDGAAWSAETATSVKVSDYCALAPVSATEFYALEKVDIESYSPRNAYRLKYVNGSAVTYWDGRIYNADVRWFDAVRLNGVDYIYGQEYGGRGVYLKKEGTSWSALKPLIPMDVIEDIFSFHPNLVSVINGKVLITGVMYRGETMIPLHIYMLGPQQPAMGRDMFIWKGTAERAVGGGARYLHTSTEPATGKLHLVGNEIWYVGPHLVAKAPVTSIFGVDNPAQDAHRRPG